MWLTVVMMQIKTIKEKAEEEKKKNRRKIFENQNQLRNSKEIRTTKYQQDILDIEAEPPSCYHYPLQNIHFPLPACPACPSVQSLLYSILYYPVSVSHSLLVVSLPYIYLAGL